MGQAKRRAEMREQNEQALGKVDIPRLAGAIRRLSTAASAHFGSDCFMHAALVQAFLAEYGVKADLVIGFAAWRVGEGNGDVITHAPMPNLQLQPGGAPYHVWLEIGRHIFDTTTYQLQTKAEDLDRLDGGHTTVDWCPDFLFVEKRTVSSLSKVAQERAGMYYYEANDIVAKQVLEASKGIDQEDLAILKMLYGAPDLVVMGPNSM